MHMKMQMCLLASVVLSDVDSRNYDHLPFHWKFI